MPPSSAVLAIVVASSAGLFPAALAAQEYVEQGVGAYRLRQSPAAWTPAVAFLEHAPVIDGVLDPGLANLQRGFFSEVVVDGRGPETERADRAAVSRAEPTFRMAYGTDFFYLYVEAPGERLQCRDRAYQNGDGFSLMLGAAQPDAAATDEFYVLSCSAVDDARMEWSRHVFWYYNIEDIFVPTSGETQLEFRASGGRISFELRLPWRDVHPHHPWFGAELGFNLRFVRAVGEGARYKYIVVPDAIGAEYRSRRYARLAFAQPQVSEAPQTFLQLARGHLRRGGALRASAATASAASRDEMLELRVDSDSLEGCLRTAARYACRPGLTRHEIPIDVSSLPPGDYRVAWSSRVWGTSGHTEFTVLADHDFAVLRERLHALQGRIATGSITTLEWTTDHLESELAATRSYETCREFRTALDLLLERLVQAERGEDPYAERTGFFRRAYRSDVDGSLQPYTVIVPEELDRSRSHPLVVFLHGSASDETNLWGFRPIVPEGHIGLGVRGRGPSNLYCFDHAQTDIEEAIADVMANYPVDPQRILLAGFSMGGYGVYRTFHEHPERYRALAVLSGKPYGGGRWRRPCRSEIERAGAALQMPPELPAGAVPVLDFRCLENLLPFADVPIFIYHGRRDRNCPYETTAALVAKLRQAGARVEFVTDPDRGHEVPSEKAYDAYRRWVASLEGIE
ncbi:MAG: prolyl oligopeptidase family serine peptidase [Candidatus Eisenbacteria bacterium]|nr:prolyl oligopeptidase family serine peptidase [Candidatus Eisenbacteria bacterium]